MTDTEFQKMQNKIIIGIDPGTKTGFSVKDLKTGEFLQIETLSIVAAMAEVKIYLDRYGRDKVYLVFEDARKRRWINDSHMNESRKKGLRQGAGSIKRDCNIWEEFCDYNDIQFVAPAPAKGRTKHTAEYFQRLTGWKSRTSEHARDAAMLIWGIVS